MTVPSLLELESEKAGFRFPHPHLSEKTAVMAELSLTEDGFTSRLFWK
jgi:hypothetical protein